MQPGISIEFLLNSQILPLYGNRLLEIRWKYLQALPRGFAMHQSRKKFHDH